MRIKVTGKQRVLVRVEFDRAKGAVVFRYDPAPRLWRYTDCTAGDVLQRFDTAMKPYAGVSLEENVRRAIQNEVQLVLDALVDAGQLWVVDEQEKN